MSGPTPFRVDVPDSALADLNERVARTRWPSVVVDDWSEGTALVYTKELARSWIEEFDWRAQERSLNELPQVIADIDGQQIHAVHRPGVGPDPLPLVLNHGWPSSFIEWRHVIDALADPARHGGDPRDAFHVVAPSLPGFGFSGIPTRPGTTPRRIAGLLAGLMAALGYDRFGAHGCDWGSYVAALLALDHADRVVGVHMGMLSLSGPGQPGARQPDAPADEADRQHARRWREQEQAYIAIQSSKPQTLAFGLTDSPVGLAAWIAEKWRAWADCNGELERVISRDDLLANISIYWFTGTIHSSNRLYRENRLHPVTLQAGERVTVPAGFLLERPQRGASFLPVPRVGAGPRERAERAFDVHRWTVVERGGHFPALEIPLVFVEEVRAFFRPLR